MQNEAYFPFCHAERSEASMNGFLTAFGMTRKSERNDTFAFVMLAERISPFCHAERSEASMSGFLTGVRNDRKKCLERHSMSC